MGDIFNLQDNPLFKVLQKEKKLDEREIAFRYHLNKIANYIVYYCGLFEILRKRDCNKGDFPYRILKYERVLSDNEIEQGSLGNDNVISISGFKTHLELFKEKANVILLSELVQKISRNEEIPVNTVVLTFDKAHKSIYKNVLPLLRQFKFPATLFVPTAYIGRQLMLWEERVLTAIKLIKQNNIALNIPEIETFNAIYQNFNSQIEIPTDWSFAFITYLKAQPANERFAIIETIINHLEKITSLPKVDTFMSWKELELAFQDGFEIGSMGHSYQFFHDLSKEEIHEDLMISFQTLAEHNIKPCDILCPPDQNEFFPETRKMLVELGYQKFVGGEFFWEGNNSLELGQYCHRDTLYDFTRSLPNLSMILWNLKLLGYK